MQRIDHADISQGRNQATYTDIDNLMNKTYNMNIKTKGHSDQGGRQRDREGRAGNPKPKPNNKCAYTCNLNSNRTTSFDSKAYKEMIETCAALSDEVRSFLVDTGATATFCWTDVTPYLSDVRPSKSKVQAANHSYIKGKDTGTLSMYVLNMTKDRQVRDVSVLREEVTTMSKTDLADELLSMSNLYKEG